ncbi:MAG: long-chain fatty acid--CoA ligase [Lentimicrobiaceae bacterium]|nr:long-chain fatty acid--CoA ligase [Lentimicrobiaceae bacterium]MCB9023898.1 long-chain fatty acid--CoA ligase [Lentimicrobiaceae bacterium]MCO5266193.1 long-chain fatty acid--CoA ligase [Lentimicrobium sp.]
MENVTRLFDLLPRYQENFKPKDDAIAGKENGKWVRYSIDKYRTAADSISYALLASGVKAGDRVATIMPSRPEWNFLDMGIMQAGAVHVPVYPTISESDYKHILNHAGVKFIFISGKDIYRKIEHIVPDIEGLIEVFAVKETEGVRTLSAFMEYGSQNANPQLLDSIKSTVKSDDLATLIYTSGTTGNPKGVMLSHANIISNFKGVSHIPPIGEEGRALSYLPLCHVYERMLNYMYQYLGISVYYAENMATIGDNLKEIQPDILTTVPRLLEKIYDKIIGTGRKLKGIKKVIFFWSVSVGLRFELNGKNGWYYETKLKIARKLVFNKWKVAVGGNMKVIVSGGAALQPRLARIFWAAGIPVLEGYGLTETSPVIAVNDFDENGLLFGTVGRVLKCVDARIAEDDEILCKGPGLMLGYYKEPELTAEAIDADGWFHTGDIGVIGELGHLKITGRKKEIFKTSLGKYISPELIENKFKESSFIDTLMVVGENQKFAAALIVPDFVYLRNWCAIKEIEYTTDAEMILLPRIKKRFQKELDKYNKFFGATEQVKRFVLIDHEWTIESGELTASLKLRRKFICQKYDAVTRLIFNIDSDD